MLPDRDRAARVWIDERLAAWAMAHGIQIDAISWRETTDATGALAESVLVRVATRERSITFADADLDRVPHHAATTEMVDERCAELMDGFLQ
jgi:hypothetical protein